jgi:mono/diheme cytochrome c family protein
MENNSRDIIGIAKKSIIPLFGLLLICAVATADENQVAKGREIYTENCASCHGVSGEGDGPLARVLTTPPANLRLLAERYGNPLPEEQIARFIDGRTDVKAHGPRDMPVWGKRFYPEAHANEREVKDRIASLVAFLQTLQRAPRSASRD